MLCILPLSWQVKFRMKTHVSVNAKKLRFVAVSVCSRNLKFLKEIEEDPVLSVQEINPALYKHVVDMSDMKVREDTLELRLPVV